MTRHLNLGHDRHEPLRRERHHLADLILRVVAAVRDAVVRALVAHADRRIAPRADARQPRVFLDLDAPALVVDEVPLEDVQFVQRERCDVLLHLGHRREMPAHVQQRAAPAEARPVLDFQRGHGEPAAPRAPAEALDIGRQQLPQRNR